MTDADGHADNMTFKMLKIFSDFVEQVSKSATKTLLSLFTK